MAKMKRKPWQYESGTFIYNETTLNHILLNKNIENFLEIGEHDHNLFLIGPKGTGKTLFLNLKSYLTRQKYKDQGIKIYPERRLCENLLLDNRTLGKEELIRFTDMALWNKIWRLVLSLIVCRITNTHIENKELNAMQANGDSISALLTLILSERSALDKYITLLPILSKKIESVNHGVSIFIDNVDQVFSQFLSDQHPTDYLSIRISPSVDVWTNAQVGLLSATYELNRHNPHIKVYSSIRAEAFRCIGNEMKLNYKNFTTNLKYSKEELKQIFEINIQLMIDKKELELDENGLIYSFLGIKKIPHLVVKNEQGNYQKEKVFDYIYRHTMGRPRELVLMGNYLYLHVVSNANYHDLPKSEKIQKIREAVSKTSNDIIDVYLNEIIPRFDQSILIEFIKFFQSNVIPAKHLIKNYKELLIHYFSIGIVGFAQRKVHDSKKFKYIQKFLPASEYSYKKCLVLPNTNYFMTHPCLDNYLKRTLDFRFYNLHNIIGNGYEFTEKLGMSEVYDVALSYASEERAYVEEVAEYLNQKDIKVFYDRLDKGNLWGNNLEQYLQQVYRYSSKYCVLFLSDNYLDKPWTKFELKNLLERYNENDSIRYLLPIKFGEVNIEELNELVFLNAEEETPFEIADLISSTILDVESTLNLEKIYPGLNE